MLLLPGIFNGVQHAIGHAKEKKDAIRDKGLFVVHYAVAGRVAIRFRVVTIMLEDWCTMTRLRTKSWHK